jgi:hypothetical protein
MTSAGERSVRGADDDEGGTASAKRPLRFDVVDSAPIHNCRYSRVWFWKWNRMALVKNAQKMARKRTEERQKVPGKEKEG